MNASCCVINVAMATSHIQYWLNHVISVSDLTQRAGSIHMCISERGMNLPGIVFLYISLSDLILTVYNKH